MNDKLEQVMQESRPIGEVPIGDTANPANGASNAEQTSPSLSEDKAPKTVTHKQPDGPPQALSSINPVFYNTVVSAMQTLSGGISTLKDTVSSVMPGSKSNTPPAEIAQKRQAEMQQVITDPNELKPKKNKFIGPVVVVVLLVAIGVVGYQAFNALRGNGVLDGLTGGNGEPTPTLSQLEPEVPSIYARDEVILILEEDINTLDGQLSSTVLKESSLDTPQLDFDIRF